MAYNHPDAYVDEQLTVYADAIQPLSAADALTVAQADQRYRRVQDPVPVAVPSSTPAAISAGQDTDPQARFTVSPDGRIHLGDGTNDPDVTLRRLGPQTLGLDGALVQNGYAVLDESDKGVANGVAQLDATGRIPASQAPDLSGNFLLASKVGVASGVASLDSSGKVPTTQVPDLTSTYVAASKLGAANGVAALDSTGRVPAGQAPLIGRSTLFVAASNATAADKARADYIADGVADEVEINAALVAIRAAGGGTVLLSGGVFTLAGPIRMEGTDNVNDLRGVGLHGSGVGVTRLSVPTGVTEGIRLSKCVIASVRDLSIEITGSTSHGISSYATIAGSYRSFWHSEFKNLRISGPWTTAHTGWAMNLGSAFRSVFSNIEVGGTGNGIYLFSEFAAQNPGDCSFERIFVEISGNNAYAYKIESPADVNNGVMNQIEFSMCEAFANGTGCTAFWIGGIGTTTHIHVRGANLEQFDKLIDISNGGKCTFRLNFVQLRYSTAGLVGFNFGANSYGNAILSVGEFHADAAVQLYADASNTFVDDPNRIEGVFIYAESTATVTGTSNSVGTTVRRAITAGGSGTTTAVKRYAPVDAPNSVQTLTDAATIALNAARSTHFRVTLAGNRTLGVPTNPTDGQRILIEVTQDATGSRTLTPTTGSAGAWAFGSDITALSLSTAGGKTDVIGAIYSAAKSRWLIVSIVRGF